MKPVVTIFEQYGAGAEEVGRRVAEELGLPFHPQAFSSAELEGSAGTPTDQAAVLSRVLTVMGGAYGGFEGRDVVTTQREKHDLVLHNNRVVWDEADQGGVIVGRNGAMVLAQRPDTVHVLLTGSRADRIARAAAREGLDPEVAARRQEREDEVRAEMSQVLYGWDPRLPDRYDVVLNTSRIPVEAAAAAILDLVRLRAG